MTRANLAAALVFDAIVALSATARSADSAQGVSTRRRSLFVAPSPAAVPVHSKIDPTPRREPHAVPAAVTPDVVADKDFNTTTSGVTAAGTA